jgi:hypothetical protein
MKCLVKKMNEDKNFMEFLKALECSIRCNIDFLEGNVETTNGLIIKYRAEISKIANLINEFDFVTNASTH